MGKQVENCLVCNNEVHFDDFTDHDHSSSSFKWSRNSFIAKHLSGIFILRNILEVPVEQVAEELERNPEIEQWIRLCGRCSKMVEKCGRIYCQLVEISKRFKACRLEIIKIVRGSRGEGETSVAKSGEHGRGPYEDSNFVDKVRLLVVNSIYENLTDPDCENGDLLAAQAAAKEKVQICEGHEANVLSVCKEVSVKAEVDEEKRKTICTPPVPEEVTPPLKTEKREEGIDYPESDNEWQPDLDNSDNEDETASSSMDGDSDDDNASSNEEDDNCSSDEDSDDKVSEMVRRRKAHEKKQKQYRLTRKVINCLFCSSHRLNISHYRKSIIGTCGHLQKCCVVNSGKNVKTMQAVTELKCDICSQYSCSVNDIYGFVYHMLCCAYLDNTSNSLLPPLKYRAFRCNICQERKVKKVHHSYFNLEGFLEHYLFHKGISYQCTECEQMFSNIDLSHSHWRTAHKELLQNVTDLSACQRKLDSPPLPVVPWWCSKCGQVFDEEIKRNEHFKSNHPSFSSRAREDQKEAANKCQFCENEYQCSDELAVHQVTTHGCEVKCKKLVHCDLCTDTFPSEKSLQKHRRRVHRLDRFECQICKRSFLESHTLKEHMKIHEMKTDDGNSVKMKLECDLCKKTYLTEKNLSTHIAIVHDNAVLFSCHICGKNFARKSSLKKHLVSVHEIGKVIRFNCTVEGCGKTFKARHSYQAHVAMHEKTSVQPCSFCGKEFYSALRLKSHEKKVHENAQDPSKQLQCDQCPFQTIYAFNLKLHQNKAHNPDGTGIPQKQHKCHSCDKCSQVFTSLKKLCAHRREHHGLKRQRHTVSKTKKVRTLYNCKFEDCGESFRNENRLRLHERKFHKTVRKRRAEPIQCKDCGKLFKRAYEFKRHSLVHQPSREKNFVCDICGKAFISQNDLSLHKQRSLQCKRLHMTEEEATVACDICQKRYSCKINLAKHVRERHEGIFREICEHCGKGLVDKASLTKHLAKVHKIEEAILITARHKCPEEGCDKSFFEKRNLQDHISKHKGEPGYKCKHCGKNFYASKYLSQHVRCVHEGQRYGKQKPKVNKVVVTGMKNA